MTITDWKETIDNKPINKNRKPPIRVCFQAIIVSMIKIKLGIRWIRRAKNHWDFPKTSKANMLMKRIKNIAKIRGNQ